MKKSLFSLIILSCLVYNISLGQDRQEVTLGKFIITDAKMNGVDITPEILEAEAFTVFYTYENEESLNMANVWPKKNSQSYGPMYSFVIEDEKQEYEGHPADYFHFNWQYTNDYDSKKGTSKVAVIRIFKPQGVIIILKMLTESLELLVYTGYLDGSLDFSAFQ